MKMKAEKCYSAVRASFNEEVEERLTSLSLCVIDITILSDLCCVCAASKMSMQNATLLIVECSFYVMNLKFHNFQRLEKFRTLNKLTFKDRC